jgi:predicted short-subunit dehydrogenase-like oxidoreductase (DUF2520 family)
MVPTRTRPGSSIAIIGAGRLGTALALALERAGHRVETLVARNKLNAKKAARLLDVQPRALAAKELSKLHLTDIVIIATPDDHIADVGARLLEVDRASFSTSVVFHTSGALSSVILESLKTRNWSVGSLHPLISVSSRESSIEGAFWSIEGDRKARAVARKLVIDLKGQSFAVESAKKPLYHAAALMSAGGVVALFDVAIEMMVRSGVDRSTSRKVLQPLIRSVVESLDKKDTAESLTGTFSRGDLKTVVKHLESLADSDLDDAYQLYKILGKRSLRLAQRRNLKTKAIKDIEALLK